MPKRLGRIMNAGECQRALTATPDWKGAGEAVYLLWDLDGETPIYCGTAEGKARLRGHLRKDHLCEREPSAVESRNPELVRYCSARRPGWLGVSFKVMDDKATAQSIEQAIISDLGIRRFGGVLFNQRLRG